MDVVELVTALAGAGLLWFAAGFRVVRQYERGVVFRFGRVREQVSAPGLTRSRCR